MRFKIPGSHIAPVIVCVLALTALPAQVGADAGDFAGGDGSAEDPYQITDWYQLDAVRDHLDACFILVNDLDSGTGGYDELAGSEANEGLGWEPIGVSSARFSGTFDGKGFEVKGLFINRDGQDFVGLFGSVDVEGCIELVEVVEAQVTGNLYVGALVGYIDGAVTGCSVVGASKGVVGVDHVGGLVGVNLGTVHLCHAIGAVNGEDWVGGLVAWNEGLLSRSWSSGDVVGNHCVGGLVGLNDSGTVIDCYATGDATALTDWYVGGLVGYGTNGALENCYSTGVPTGVGEVGGLVGHHDGTVSDCFWDEDTSGMTVSAGGIGKTTVEMMDIATFSAWDIVSVVPGDKCPHSTWNIRIDGGGYPFLSWYEARFDLKAGWNMVSVPAGLPDGDDTPADVFGSEIEAIYCWDPVGKCYVVPSVLEPESGYWVAVMQDKVITYVA